MAGSSCVRQAGKETFLRHTLRTFNLNNSWAETLHHLRHFGCTVDDNGRGAEHVHVSGLILAQSSRRVILCGLQDGIEC